MIYNKQATQPPFRMICVAFIFSYYAEGSERQGNNLCESDSVPNLMCAFAQKLCVLDNLLLVEA